MLKYLIAVDGSGPSLDAIERVAHKARSGVGIEIVLINVRDTSLPYDDLSSSDLEALCAVQKRLQKRLLNDAEARALGCGLQVCTVLSAEGAPAQEIVRAASEHGVDQIVMGAQGPGATRGAGRLPGSVAQRVVALARQPVLLVP